MANHPLCDRVRTSVRGRLFTSLVGIGVVLAALLTPAFSGLQGAGASQAQPSCEIYSEDFQGAVGQEWNNTTVSVAPANANRKFLGQFSNQTVTLTLQNLPAHSQAQVLFDYYAIRSLDGNSTEAGPDVFTLSADAGPAILHTTFSNINGSPQAYPGTYPGGSFAARTGADEGNSLGYTFGDFWAQSPMDAVYNIGTGSEGQFAHSGSTMTVNFSMSGLEEIANESWGIDNVRVLVDCAQQPPPPGGTTYHRLSVAKTGTGTGTVTAQGAEIRCGTDCDDLVAQSTIVTLTADPDSDSTFTGWSGPCSGTGSCTVSVNSATEVVANFAKKTYALTVDRAGTGTGAVSSSPGSISCGGTCADTFAHGTTVTLLANAAEGSVFSGWSGACAGSATTCEVTMTEARNVTATFTETPSDPPNFELTVTRTGGGSGTVTSNPAGINCGADCTQTYAQNTSVTLTATPSQSSVFSGWSGACTGTGQCTVTMTAARSVAAQFSPQPPPPGTPDLDRDQIADADDNCPGAANADQADRDDDGVGDACDDADADDVPDASDNCPDDSNPTQSDTDDDGSGDACDEVDDSDSDGDEVPDTDDNCPGKANPNQQDTDGDTVGDACDETPVPVVFTAVDIDYNGRTDTLHGSLRETGAVAKMLAGAQQGDDCTQGRNIVVKKVKKGRDRIVARATTGPNGRWSVDDFTRHGTFYAKAWQKETSDAVCAKAVSRRIRI